MTLGVRLAQWFGVYPTDLPSKATLGRVSTWEIFQAAGNLYLFTLQQVKIQTNMRHNNPSDREKVLELDE